MKTIPLIFRLGVAAMPVQAVHADLFITNFESPVTSAAAANGVWRNSTSASDLAIPISLTQTGAVIKSEVDDDPSITDDSFLWFDDPFNGTNLFDSDTVNQFSGDYILLEVGGGANVSVVIDFNAEVVDPILHFTDVDTQTTLVFQTGSPTKLAGLGNMLVAGNSVTTSGVPTSLLFRLTEETLGSLKFTGTFTKLEFTIMNDGSDPINNEDRTGFVVTTETAPVPLTSGPPPKLDISVNGDQVILDWGEIGALSELQMLDSEGHWMKVEGSNPAVSSGIVLSKMVIGPSGIFRGID